MTTDYVPEPFTPAEAQLIAYSEDELDKANRADIAQKILVEAAYDAWDAANPGEPPIRNLLANLARQAREAREKCNALNSQASGSRLERERQKSGSYGVRARRRRGSVVDYVPEYR